MRFTYDQEVDILNIVLADVPAVRSKEIGRGIVTDFASDGRLVSVEIQGAGKLYPDEDLSVLPAFPQWLSLSEASSRTGLNEATLRRQAMKGKLHAQKVGRNWATTQEWLEEYLAKHRRLRSEKVTH